MLDYSGNTESRIPPAILLSKNRYGRRFNAKRTRATADTICMMGHRAIRQLAKGVGARPNLRLGLCGLFLMFGPSVFMLGTAIVASGIIRTFPEAPFATLLWRFGMTVVLSRSAAYGCASLACLGPPVVVFSLWRAWLRYRLNRITRCRNSRIADPLQLECGKSSYRRVG